MTSYKIETIERPDDDEGNVYNIYKDNVLVYTLIAYKEPILLDQPTGAWLISYNDSNDYWQLFTNLTTLKTYDHDIDAIYWGSVELINDNKFLLIKGGSQFCRSIEINIIYDVRNLTQVFSRECPYLPSVLDNRSLINVNDDIIECYHECNNEKIIFKTYKIIDDVFVDQNSHEGNMEIIENFWKAKRRAKFEPENLDNISKYIENDNNIFKQWLRGNATGSTLVNNCENSSRLLNERNIKYIECIGHYSKSEFNSNVKYFLTHIDLTNIINDLSVDDNVVHWNQQGYYKVDRNGVLFNRTLADQIQLLTCSRVYHAFKDKTKVWCESKILNNIGLEFIFNCDDYKVTFLVEVFLEKFIDSSGDVEKEMSIFQSTNQVKITIY
jgi:hypothetical protein